MSSYEKHKKDCSFDISTTGWNSAANHHYKPLGELGNVYRGCKIVKEKLSRFNVDFELPEKKKYCKFLKGEDRLLNFVTKYKEEAKQNQRDDFNEKSQKAKSDLQKKESQPNKWVRRAESQDDGMQILKEQLIDSFIRLSSARAGSYIKEIFYDHEPNHYSPGKIYYKSLVRPCISIKAEMTNTQCQPSLNTHYSKRLSIKDFNDVSLRNQKRNFSKESRVNNSCDISIQTSKTIKPYIRLVSLKDVIRHSETSSRIPSIPGLTRKFDPTKLVELVDTALDKLYQNAIKVKSPSRKRLSRPPNRRRLTCNFIGTKDFLDNSRLLKRKATVVFLNALDENESFSPIKRKEVKKKVKRVNPLTDLEGVSITTTTDLMNSLAVYNNKKEDLKKALANSLEVQSNNRYDVIEYKRHNFNLELSNKTFQYEFHKMLVSAEKEKIEKRIFSIKNYTNSYYRLIFELLKKGNEFAQEIHFIMDYYKSIIESGNTIKAEHVIYLMENVYPSDNTQQVTEYINNK